MITGRKRSRSTGEISGHPRGIRWPSAGRNLAAYGELSTAAVSRRFPSRHTRGWGPGRYLRPRSVRSVCGAPGVTGCCLRHLFWQPAGQWRWSLPGGRPDRETRGCRTAADHGRSRELATVGGAAAACAGSNQHLGDDGARAGGHGRCLLAAALARERSAGWCSVSAASACRGDGSASARWRRPDLCPRQEVIEGLCGGRGGSSRLRLPARAMPDVLQATGAP